MGDPVFRGVYHGKVVHEDDFEDVLSRARTAGCRKFMVTGSDLIESQRAVELAKDYRKGTLSHFVRWIDSTPVVRLSL